MRAVNLIPVEQRGRAAAGRRIAPGSFGPGSGVIAVLAVAVLVALVTVLEANSVSSRKAQLQTLQAQVASTTAEAQRLAVYTSFVQTARQREEAVREIAAGRFDWQGALRQLSLVVPADTSFQSLNATVAPGAGTGGAGTGNLRGDIDAPAFEITGCTASQDEVARLMVRLRAISGVTRVTLGSSQKSSGESTATNAKTGQARGCRANTPTFDVVVFFSPLPTAGPSGITAATPVSTTTATTP